MKKWKAWTTKEIAFLRENRNQMTIAQLGKKLGRTHEAVAFALKKQGIKKELLFKVIKKDEVLAFGTVEECAKILNVKKSTVFAYATPHRRKAGKEKGYMYAVRI